LLRDNGAELPGRFTYEEIGEDRTRGNSGDAPLGLKASRGDTLAVEPHGQPQNVTAHWIADLDRDAGVGQFPGVMRIVKMVEDSVVEQEKYLGPKKELRRPYSVMIAT
jgi:hypothetical protein